LVKYLYADPLKCSGCKICELVCSFTFNGVLDPNRARIKVVSLGHLDEVLVCRNCRDAPCIEACPREAIYRDERGVVMVNEVKCVGCGTCVKVCPFEAIKVHPNRKVAVKCVLCGSCIEWCPAECLEVVEE